VRPATAPACDQWTLEGGGGHGFAADWAVTSGRGGDIDPSAPLAMPLMLPTNIALSISVLTIKPPDAMSLALPMERF
jgi:hypothetical protein